MTDDVEETQGTKTLGVNGVPPSTTSSAAAPSAGITSTPSTKKAGNTSKPVDAQPGQTASPNLTDGPSHISTERSDPTPSGPETSHPGSGSTPAGGAAPTGDPSSGQSSKPEDKEQGGANPLKEPSEKSEEDKNDPGTGLQYVKSTGVLAEGGDFDAKNPGAGVR